MVTILGLITARGGSKGIPRKNVLPVAGKPLIAWTIEAALRSTRLTGVIVSTDDLEIAQVAREYGAEIPFMRPDDLAQDTSSHISVVEHTIQWLQNHERMPDYLLLLQPTSPLRTTEDIDAAIKIVDTTGAVSVISVNTVHQHPYLMKRVDENGTLVNAFETDLPYLRRQDFPLLYALNGAIYLTQVHALIEQRTFLPQGTRPYIMPTERSLDVDTPWDLHLADLILRDMYA